jgi:hypothetical protein
MSFGYYDKDWVDPDPEPEYGGTCGECERFGRCPCGCGWGVCALAPGEFLDGDEEGCESGCPRW